MEVHHLDSLRPLGWPRPAVTVGNFDGVHLGHQALARAVVQEARRDGGTPVVLTFDPHPSRILSPDRAPAALMTLDQKVEALAVLGVDRVAVLPFTFELAQKTAEQFARDVIAGALGARRVIVGENFRFGRHRSGDVAFLGEQGRILGFEVRGEAAILHEGAAVSSTRIREALARGEVENARVMLGRPHFVEGRVVRGDERGRRLGIPTANVAPINEMLPASGVYACTCGPEPEGRDRLRLVGFAQEAKAGSSGAPLEKPVAAVVNVGRRPTFGGLTRIVEAHLLDFSGDLYGRGLRLAFWSRLREERTFASAEELVAQIHRDIAASRAILRAASASAGSESS